MSTINDDYRMFAGGIVLGLAFAGVTLLTVGAARRMVAARRRLEAAPLKQHAPFIDGVRPPDPAVLDALPDVETSSPGKLASERPDFSPASQRW